jgi:ABC-type multidrug transport system ATPase subunit
MINAKHLSKSFGEAQVVSDVSFSAQKGEIVGFLGPNGAGKTTTIRMLATYLPPSSGEAIVAGYDVVKDSDQVRRRIGYLPENPPLYGEMTVSEYLSFVAQIKRVPKAAAKSRIEQVMERCFITDVRSKICQHLSRGYRQRVGLAQAIIGEPEVIILDEPTSGLDPKQIIQIRETIKSLGADHTVLLSTHILPEVSMVCNKVVIVNRGRTVLESALQDLIKDRSLEQAFLECLGKDDSIENEIAA